MRPSGGDGEPYKVEKLKIIWKLNSRKDVFINKEWIDKMVQLSGKYCSFG